MAEESMENGHGPRTCISHRAPPGGRSNPTFFLCFLHGSNPSPLQTSPPAMNFDTYELEGWVKSSWKVNVARWLLWKLRGECWKLTWEAERCKLNVGKLEHERWKRKGGSCEVVKLCWGGESCKLRRCCCEELRRFDTQVCHVVPEFNVMQRDPMEFNRIP